MSVSSEETHDDSAQVHSSDNKGCNNLEVRGESPTGSQDSKVTGCQQSFGRAERRAVPSAKRHRKRSLSEAKLSDARLGPDDEQQSFQSAFQQYRPVPRQQQNPHSANEDAAASASQTMQMLLKAAAQSHTETGAAVATQQHSEVAGTSTNSRSMSYMSHDHPSTTPGGIQMRLSAQHSRTHPPMYDSRQQHPQAAHPVSHTPPPSQHRSTPDPLLSHTRALNPLYAPLVPKPKVGRQLTAAIAALEQPALDADAVQAALGFAAALDVGSDAATAAQSRQSRNTHSAAESIKLLQVLELSAGRLDVLRILTCRLTATGGPGGQEDSSTLSQLLLVIQDLMRDMESSQRLLQRAGAVLQGHQQAALQQVRTLKAHHQAMQVFWAQGQQLDSLHVDRRGLLQQMLMQPADETGQELLDMVERLRQSIVGVLEAGARRSTASSEMQSAQAHLVRQGVCGVTSHAMLSGSVQLVIDRAGIRLDMLQRIVACLESSQAGLLAALLLTLEAPAWQSPSQSQLAEAIGGTRVRAEHLLGQLRSVRHLGSALAPIKTAAPAPASSRATLLEGVTAQIHDTMVPQHHAGALDTQHRHREEEWLAASLAKQRQAGRGSLAAEGPWGSSGPAKRSKLDPRERPSAHAPAQQLYTDAAQVHGRDAGEHLVLRPHAQRPSGQLPSLQPGASQPFPHPTTGPNRMSPAPSADSPSAGQTRRRSLDKKRPHQEKDPANQDSRALSEDRRTQGVTRPDVLQLLSSLGELSRPQAAKPASPSLAGEASLAGSLPGSAREDALKASRKGSLEQHFRQDSQSPREGASQYKEGQTDPQSIAAAYAQLCAFLKQQKQPPPPPL